MLWLYILIFIISCLILICSSTWIIQALTRIARFLEWREFIVASLLMAFATSLPEFFVGVFSAFHKRPQLSFGDVIGSNIIVLTLVMGIGILMAKRLKFEGKILQRSSLYACLIAPLPLLLMLDGKISRWDGVILFLALGFYFQRLLLQKERFTKVFSHAFNRKRAHFKLFLKDLGIFLAGVSLLLCSAEGIVWSTSNLAREFNLPLVIIGLLLVALGTSTPEIAFGIKSITMGHKEMILGDAMGSVVVNSTLILGTVALIYPLEIPDFSPYFIGIIFTVITCLFFAIFARTDREITRREAIFLLFVYATFVICEIITLPKG